MSVSLLVAVQVALLALGCLLAAVARLRDNRKRLRHRMRSVNPRGRRISPYVI